MSEHAEDSPQKRWGHQHRRMRPWAKAKPSEEGDSARREDQILRLMMMMMMTTMLFSMITSLSMISDFSRSEHLRFP